MSVQTIYSTKLRCPLWQSASSSTKIFNCKSSQFCSSNSVCFRTDRIWRPKTKRCVVGIVSAALQSESPSAVYEERWLLEPAGDGDWRHIGFKVALPGAFEISSDAVTVGRVPEKADLVIPVATVSGAHARLEKKGGGLLVTDLESTNGTFVGEKRLIPGVPVAAPPGSYITFGDTNLAIFRLSKIKNLKPATVSDEPEAEPKSASPTDNSEKAS